MGLFFLFFIEELFTDGFLDRDHVYERIFRNYCGRYGVLRRFNVTEITAQAAYLKHMIVKDDQIEGRETEDWVLKIPVLP